MTVENNANDKSIRRSVFTILLRESRSIDFIYRLNHFFVYLLHASMEINRRIYGYVPAYDICIDKGRHVYRDLCETYVRVYNIWMDTDRVFLEAFNRQS